MKETKVAKRYAKALFELALEMKILDQVMGDARLIYSVCENNRDFVLMLRSPVIKETKKNSVIRSIFGEKIHELTLKFMAIITQNNREGLIQEIASQFLELYKEFNNIISAGIQTAVKIDSETREKVLQVLRDQTKAKIELDETVSEELLGGFVLSFDDKQYDASILRQIKNLRKEFDINLYIKGF